VKIFGGEWCWLDSWRKAVHAHCEKMGDCYR